LYGKQTYSDNNNFQSQNRERGNSNSNNYGNRGNDRNRGNSSSNRSGHNQQDYGGTKCRKCFNFGHIAKNCNMPGVVMIAQNQGNSQASNIEQNGRNNKNDRDNRQDQRNQNSNERVEYEKERDLNFQGRNPEGCNRGYSPRQ
jgi:hypothetical protein